MSWKPMGVFYEGGSEQGREMLLSAERGKS